MTPKELRTFLRLYRQVTRDLTLARTKSNNAGLIEALNALAGRAYGILYRAPRRSVWSALWDALETVADTVRRRRNFVFISTGLFFASAIFAFMLLNVVPQTRDFFVPAGFEQAFEGWKTGTFESRTGSEGIGATAFYAQNNPRASIVTGAFGAGSFGVMSVYLIATNGALIGTLTHELAPLGLVGFLFSSIFPHGVPELSGIFIAGACGMMLGWALINPGQKTRGDALKAVGKDAFVLLATSVVLMFIAAPIEGFFSFNPQVPQWLKVVVGAVEVVLWGLFWTQFGRKDRPVETY